MATDNPRRQNRTASTTPQVDQPSTGRSAQTTRAGAINRLIQLASEWRGAIEDHRKWINSDRARSLETTFGVSGRLLVYAAYLSLAYLAFTGLEGIRNGLSTGLYAIPGHIDGYRVALFYILAAGLVGPLAIITIGIGIGWTYNLATATANRALPRFLYPWVHPSILFAVVAAFAVFHTDVTATVARGYLYAKAIIEAASPQEVVSLKVVEIPGPDIPHPLEAMDQDSSSERELVRLRSMFSSNRPCPKEGQPEAVRPEPGLAPGSDCQVAKMPSQE